MYNDEERDYYDEEELDNEELEEEEEERVITLKGVGVKDTNNGISIMLMSVDEEVIALYNVNVDLTKYDDIKLCKICYNISKKVNDLYYQMNGELTKDIVENAVREEIQ